MQHEKLQRLTTYFICVLFTFRKALRPVFANNLFYLCTFYVQKSFATGFRDCENWSYSFAFFGNERYTIKVKLSL